MIWVVGREGARRIDPTSGAVVALLPGHGVTEFGDGAFWSLATNPDRRCDGPEGSFPSYSPYRVEKIDPQTNAVAFGVDLPGTCRYGSDNRSPSAELAVGAGAAWAVDPTTCRLFRIDANRGTVTTLPQVGGRLVAADAKGVWLAPGPSTYRGGTCAPARWGLTRIDPAGTVGPTVRVRGLDLTAGDSAGRDGMAVSIADDVAWVTYSRASGVAFFSTLARVDLTTGAVGATRISPGGVATGDGHVWFLGSFPGNRRTPRDTKPGLLGEIDPRTGAVKRAFQLDLGSSKWPRAGIVAVSSDAVWILTSEPTREIIQVAT